MSSHQTILDLISKYRKLSGDNETKNFYHMDKNLFNYSTIEEAHIFDNNVIMDFPYFKVIFRISGYGGKIPPLMLQVRCEEKVSEIIKRYRIIANDYV